MTLLVPGRLWLLAAVGAIAVAYVILQRRRRHYAVRFTNLELLDSVAPRRPGWRRHVAAGAAVLALVALVVALARPARDERIPRRQGIIMLTVDVSASMTATDVSPSRMAAATAAAEDFVGRLPGSFQVGLVAFDGAARLVAPPTSDHATVLSAIQRLTPGPGTAAGEGIYAALDAIETTLRDGDTTTTAPDTPSATRSRPAATIVLLSDGVTTAGRPVEEAAKAAADVNVPITTIAYGTDQGTVVVEGQVVPVPADPATMEAVAEATGGSSFEAATGDQLRAAYRNIEGRVGYSTETRDLTMWFVAIAAVALILAVAASMLWTARFM
jgi:Ca-activated chloride channel family protein